MLRANLYFFHCYHIGDTIVLHTAIDISFVAAYMKSFMVQLKNETTTKLVVKFTFTNETNDTYLPKHNLLFHDFDLKINNFQML